MLVLCVVLNDWVVEYQCQLGVVGILVVQVGVCVLIGMVFGVMIVLYDELLLLKMGLLVQELIGCISCLVIVFCQVVFVQVKILLFNIVFIVIFLLGVLLLFGVYLLLFKILVLIIFLVGLLLVVGNIIFNMIIIIVVLLVLFYVVVVVLFYLIVIYKLEYFFNVCIVGGEIQVWVWELLLVMLVMEVVFGLLGLVVVLVFYVYVKCELVDQCWI